MLNGSDPFVYLGPDCPTLYYPRAVAGQTGPRQPLPSFIVHRRAVQPHGFILPTVRNRQGPPDSQSSLITSTDSNTTLDRGRSSKKFPVTLLTRGQGRKRRTGHPPGLRLTGRTTKQPRVAASVPPSLPRPYQPHRQVQNCSVQTDWLLDTRENFVFVEASQMVSEAVITGDCIAISGGDGEVVTVVGGTDVMQLVDDHNMSDIMFEPSSVLPSTAEEPTGQLFEMSLETENTQIYDETMFKGGSDDQKEMIFKILNRNSENENDVTEIDEGDGFGDEEIKTSYVENVSLSNVFIEPDEFLGGDISEVTNDYDRLDTARYVVSVSELDREKVFDMDGDEADYSHNNLDIQVAGGSLITTVDIEYSNTNKLGSSDSLEYLNNMNEEGINQAKEVVSQIIESLLEKVCLTLGSSSLNCIPEDGSKRLKNSRIEETIENIEEFIQDANNNIKTPPIVSEAQFSQDCINGSPPSMMLCPVTGLVYCSDRLNVD